MSDPAWRQRYEEIVAEVSQRPDAEVVMLGDSLTQAFRKHQDLWARGPGHRAINAGIMGDGTQHLLWRLRNGQLQGLDPKVAIILIGTNNGTSTARGIAEGIYLNVLEAKTRFPNARILVVGILPSGKDPNGTRRIRNARANELVRTELADGKQIVYLELGGRFVTSAGVITDAMRSDSLHLTRKGYELLANGIGPVVRAMLPSAQGP